MRSLRLGEGTLGDPPAAGVRPVALSAAAVVGLGKIEWCPFAPSELPGEQGPDDARSAVFDAAPATEALEILGAPTARLTVISNRPRGQLAVRLCEVTPDGRSWLVAWGVLDLTRREGLDRFDLLEPGRPYVVEVPLVFTAHRLPAGSRLRLAVSAGLWPLVWPDADAGDLTLDVRACRLDLPVRAPPAVEAGMPIALAPPLPDDPAGGPVLRVEHGSDLVQVKETWPLSPGGSGPDIQLKMTPGEPSSCVWRAGQTAAFQWAQGAVHVEALVTITAPAGAFHVEEETIATLNGETVAHLRQVTDIPRLG
jgi:hypothetical protein